jgi:hypothetical protein
VQFEAIVRHADQVEDRIDAGRGRSHRCRIGGIPDRDFGQRPVVEFSLQQRAVASDDAVARAGGLECRRDACAG